MNDRLWQRVTDHFQHEIPNKENTQWITPLRATIHGDTLLLKAHNQYVARKVTKEYLPRLRELSLEYSDPDEPIEHVVVRVEYGEASPVGPRRAGSRFDKLSVTGLRSKFTFDSFVEGTSNEWAKNAAQAVAGQPGTAYNPLLLYGDVGLGKTHLMHAVGNQIHSTRPDLRVCCKYSKQFVKEVVAGIGNGTINELTESYKNLHVLLVDDVQFFVDTRKSQEEFFHIFNSLEESECQMVFTCDRYPSEIGLDRRLSSRFVNGLTAELKPPDIETSAAILIRKAFEDGIELRESVALHLAERVSSNVREIEGIWRTIRLNYRESGYEITVDFADRVLNEVLNYKRPLITAERILEAVGDYFGVRVADLQGKSRHSDIVYARHMAIYLAREQTNLPLKSIGQQFGNRDHSSIKHAHEKVRKLLDVPDSHAKRDCEILLRKLSH